MDLHLEHHYAHPIEKVWQALTSSASLAQWLMPNDFVAEAGRECVFRFCSDDGSDRAVHVVVERLDPPRFMQWQWRHDGEPASTTVTFELEPTETGTRLRLRHHGEISPELAEGLGNGWPRKLAGIEAALET